MADINGLFPNKTTERPQMQATSFEDLEELAGKGLSDPRGHYSIREIIVAYNLTKEDFYNTLNIPYDYPDTNNIITLIKEGYATSKQMQAYMVPITENFGK